MTSAAEQDLVYDAWTPMSFKRVLGSRKQPGTTWLAPTWVGNTHTRRLMAYKLLQAYVDNASRFFRTLDPGVRTEAEDLREYGDSSLIVNSALSALIGEDVAIQVEGSDDFDASEDSDNTPEEQAAHDQQEWIDQWATDERFPLKLIETERNAVTLGDGVYVLGINYKRGRVRLRTFDPGFYFPVLDDNDDDEFPDRVHLAWEVDDDSRPGRVFVRRVTWELVELDSPVQHPWNDEPSDFGCFMTDATWELDTGKPRGVDDLNADRATYETYVDANGDEQEWKDVDLGIDFIPVVHVPNTIALANHYGKSTLAVVLQLLDDLMNADTDMQASSATTGKPPLALSGARLEDSPTYRAGEVWNLGENGKLSVLDTSASLRALAEYITFLMQRLSVNSRLPDEVLGRGGDSGAAAISGISRRLKFGPLESMVREMRMVRDEKYRLLLKFVWRMSLAARFDGVPTDWIDTGLAFGSYLPSDQAAAVDTVQKLLLAKAISVETAIRVLVEAGIPIDDAAEEVRRIQERDFDGANKLLDATADEAAVFEYLGRDQPTDQLGAPAPDPTGPPAPGQPVPDLVPNQPLPGERGAVAP